MSNLNYNKNDEDNSFEKEINEDIHQDEGKKDSSQYIPMGEDKNFLSEDELRVEEKKDKTFNVDYSSYDTQRWFVPDDEEQPMIDLTSNIAPEEKRDSLENGENNKASTNEARDMAENNDSAYSTVNTQYGNQPPYDVSPISGEQNPSIEPPLIPNSKKGRGILWIVAGTMLFICLAVTAAFAGFYLKNNILPQNEELPSHEYTSSVVEYVQVEDKESSAYDDKTVLYNDCQKSCVTVITEIENKLFGQGYSSKALGSGFVVSKEGYIVTNAHVVDGGSKFTVRFYDGAESQALLVGKDTVCDIAVLKINKVKDMIPVSFGNSDNVRIGDFVMAIGTPSGEELFGTMTYGVISGKNRKIPVDNTQGQVSKTMYLLQTDATINPGNSGGPLFNMHGQVIGINVMKLTNSYEGIGFAIPSKGAVNIINSLISTGKSDYTDSEYVKGGAQLGIKGLTVSESRDKYNLDDSCPDGVLIVTINKSSAAYKAGVSTYDIICEFNGKKIQTIEQLIEEVQKLNPGEKVTLKVYRDGRGNGPGEYLTYTFDLDSVED